MAEKNGSTTAKVDPKALWNKYLAANKAYSAAQVAQTKAAEERSVAAGAILKACGNGPFQVPGLGLVSIIARTPKDENGEPNGEPTYFMKHHGKAEIQNVEL